MILPIDHVYACAGGVAPKNAQSRMGFCMMIEWIVRRE